MKIIVPDDMKVEAARAVFNEFGRVDYHPQIRIALEAALRWLSENPILLSIKQVEAARREVCFGGHFAENYAAVFAELQRRMFLAPEPEIPEAVHDLLWNESPAPRNLPRDEEGAGVHARKLHNKQIEEAFLRGQKNGEGK